MLTKLSKDVLCIAIIVGVSFGGSGCELIDKLKGKTEKAETDEATKEKDKKKKKKSEETEEEEDDKSSTSASSSTASASSASGSSSTGAAEGDVVTYPDQVPQSGSYVLRKSFVVYQAADLNSKELGRLAAKTIINLKATYSNWMLVDWPSGIGELSPGWIQVRLNDPNLQVSKDPPDAGTKPDAAADAAADSGRTPLPDGGTGDAGILGDGGRLRIPIRLPTK